MGQIAENKVNPVWVEDIYQIEMTDPVVGGSEGIANKQAKQLAERTQYLRKAANDLSKKINSQTDDLKRKIQQFDNAAGLRQAQTGNSQIIMLAPNSSSFDGGLFYADFADKTSQDNGVTVLVSADNVRWKRIYDTLRPEYFGAVGDGVVDDSIAFLNMIELAHLLGKKTVTANQVYKITQVLNFRELPVEMLQADFKLSGGGQIIIGGHGNSSWNPDQKFGRILYGKIVIDPSQYTRPTVICMGSKGQTITIKYTDYLQLYMSTDPATYPRDASQAYSTFNINFLIKLEFATDSRFDNNVNIDGAGSANQWCNENIFNLNRCFALIIGGSYRHNCNLFVGGSFEGSKSYIDVQAGNKNKFTHTRLENVGFVRFGEKTEGNILERSYFGSTSGMILNIEDQGVFNRIETEIIDKSKVSRIFEMNPFTPKYNGFTNEYRFRQVSRVIRPTVNYGVLARTEKIKMLGKKDVLYFDFDGENSQYLFELTIFDEKGQQLDANNLLYSSGFLRPQSNKVFTGSPISNVEYGIHRFMLLSEGIYYVEIKLCGSHDFTNAKSYRLAVDYYGKYPCRNIALQKNLPTNMPDQYIGFQGDVIEWRGGKVSVDVHIQTTVLAKTTSGLILESGSFGGVVLKAGDIVGMESPSGNVQWTSLASIDGGALTLVDAPLDWVAKGDSVYISRLVRVRDDVKDLIIHTEKSRQITMPKGGAVVTVSGSLNKYPDGRVEQVFHFPNIKPIELNAEEPTLGSTPTATQGTRLGVGMWETLPNKILSVSVHVSRSSDTSSSQTYAAEAAEWQAAWDLKNQGTSRNQVVINLARIAGSADEPIDVHVFVIGY